MSFVNVDMGVSERGVQDFLVWEGRTWRFFV